MEVLPPLSCPSSSNINLLCLDQGRSCRWTTAENKMFENALAFYDKDTPDRWHVVASKIPGKTVEDVMLHYRDLELDVSKIEAGLFPAPGYSTLPPPPFTLETCAGSYLYDGFKPSSSNFRITGKRSSSSRPLDRERKKGVPWTEEEHKLFLMGLNKYGKGDWRNISRNLVVTKTPTQVASHAQKYFIRQLSGGKDKRRASIHDITTANLHETRSPSSPDYNNRRPPPPSPDHPSSYPMPPLDDHPIPASSNSFLWNQPEGVAFAASCSNVIFPPPPLGAPAGSSKIKAEPHAHFYGPDGGAFYHLAFQMQSGDCYYRKR